jgi:hypothetical protein
MSFKTPILKDLSVVSDENGVCWIFFSDLREFMNNRKHESEHKVEPGYSYECSGGKIRIHFSIEMYKEMIKMLYCSKKVDPRYFTYDEIRQMSIIPTNAKTILYYRSPQSWMPPASAIDQLGKNVECLIAYYMTAGTHNSPMPNFLQDGCLIKLKDGSIEYDLGPDVHIKDVKESLVIDQASLLEKMRQYQKRKPVKTPQKGQRRKLKPKATSTPRYADNLPHSTQKLKTNS